MPRIGRVGYLLPVVVSDKQRIGGVSRAVGRAATLCERKGWIGTHRFIRFVPVLVGTHKKRAVALAVPPRGRECLTRRRV